jgi:hypothetical protein
MMCSKNRDVIQFVQCIDNYVYTEVAFVSTSGVQRGATMTTLELIRNVVELPYVDMKTIQEPFEMYLAALQY